MHMLHHSLLCQYVSSVARNLKNTFCQVVLQLGYRFALDFISDTNLIFLFNNAQLRDALNSAIIGPSHKFDAAVIQFLINPYNPYYSSIQDPPS